MDNVKSFVFNNFYLVAVPVIAIIGFLGYKLYTKKK